MTTNRHNAPGPRRGWTRRDFVKTSAAAPFALGAGSAWGGFHLGGTETLRVGLVGCGGRGTGAAVQALRADPNVHLVALAEIFPERFDPCLKNVRDAAPEAADRVKVTPDSMFSGFDAYRDLIDSVDVVLLATTPAFRPQHLAYAVERGRHVFCEKPMAVDGPGIRSVLDSATKAREKGLSLMSGFCWRYSPPEREIYRRLHDGALGDIRSMYSTYNAGGWIEPKPRRSDWSDAEFQLRNWHYFCRFSGDHITEQAVHAIDKINWLFQRPPKSCVAVGGRQVRADLPETGNVYDHFAVTYDYGEGVKAFHMCRHYPNCPSDNSDYIAGEKGTAFVNGWQPRREIVTPAGTWRYDGPEADMYQTEHDELFAAIRAGTPVNDGEWMARSNLMAIMGRMAAYTGAEVTYDDALNSREKLLPDDLDWGPLDVPPVPTPGR